MSPAIVFPYALQQITQTSLIFIQTNAEHLNFCMAGLALPMIVSGNSAQARLLIPSKKESITDFNGKHTLNAHGSFPVLFDVISCLMPGAHCQIITADERAALHVDLASPITSICRSKLDAQTMRGFTVTMRRISR